MDMNRTLHDTNNAQRILKLTADTMLLVDKNGVCIDIDPHCDLWFLQDEILLGKNIFELLPEYTRERVVPVFQSVLEGKKHPAFLFFRDFDADCDWSEALAGEPGEFVVIVRRAGEKYFLGLPYL